jgi:hypothetical protein
MAIQPNENFLAVNINFKSAFALIDTGAVTSCISEQFARFLRLTPQATSDDVKLISANKSPIHTLGIVEAELSIQGLVVPFRFQVLKSLSHKLVLGQDFLRFSNAVIDCGHRSIEMFEGLVRASLTRFNERDVVLRLAQNIIIPAATEAIVRLVVPHLFKQKLGLMSTFAPLKNKYLVVANAIIQPQGARTIGRVLNIGQTPRRLRAGTPIACISAIDAQDPFNQAMLAAEVKTSTETSQVGQCQQIPAHEERIKVLTSLGLKLDNTNLTPEQFAQLTELLFQYQDIFCSDYENLPESKLQPYELVLTDYTPVRQRQYPLSPLQEEVMEKYADKLLKAKIVAPSKSAWNAPAILIKKSGFQLEKASDLSQWRLCLDYRRLNEHVSQEFVPIINLNQVSHLISKAVHQGQGQDTKKDQPKQLFLTTFDLTSAFFQTGLTPESSQFTAFSTRTRRLEFLRVPLGLRISSGAFISALAGVFAKEIADHTLALYVDDAILAHFSFSGHMDQLRHIFQKLRMHNLRINPKKSTFARESVTFLGFVFNASGMQLDQQRFQKIRNIRAPKNITETRQICGLVQYYKRHLPNLAKILSPIRQLLQKDVPFKWTTEHDKALEQVKDLLLQNITLAYPDFQKQFVVLVDGSKRAVGHVLAQYDGNVLKPLIFGGRSLRKFEQSGSATYIELISLLDAIKAYHPFLSNGREFLLLTDHLALTHIQNLRLESSPQLVRFSLFLQHFNFRIKHIRGSENSVCDFLSRYPSIHSPPEDTTDGGAADIQQSDDIIPQVDFYDYLSAIDVEAYNEDSETSFRDPNKKRRRNYKICHITPIDAQASNDHEIQQLAHRTPRRTDQGQQSDQAHSEQQAVTHEQTRTHADDEAQLMDTTVNEQYTQLQNQMNPEINLDSQKDDPFFEAVINQLQTGVLPTDRTLAQRILYQIDDYYIEDDQLWHLARLRGKHLTKIVPRFQQLCIPRQFRLKIMESIHNISHFSFLKCYLTARQRFYWPAMATEMAIFTKSCLVCQQIKFSAKPKYPVHAMPSHNLFECLHVDFHEIRTPKKSAPSEFKYVLVAIDQASHYVTLMPTSNMQAATAARLIMDNIILKYGTFRYLITDRSTSWLNQLFAAFLTLPGFDTHHIKTSPYRARVNSPAELVNKHLIRHIAAYASDPSQFPQYLAAIAAGINGCVNLTTGIAPFFTLYGMNFRFPFETALTSNEQAFRSYDNPTLQALAQRMKIVREIVNQNIKEAKTTMERIRNVGTKSHSFNAGDRVFISSELDRNRALNAKHGKKFSGPFVVLEVKSDLARLAHIYTGRQLPSYINVDKLRLLKDVGRDVLYNRYLRDPASDGNGQISIPEQRTIQSISTHLNYGRPMTATGHTTALTTLDTAKTKGDQSHRSDAFYDQIKRDTSLNGIEANETRGPPIVRNSAAMINQPATHFEVSTADRTHPQIMADAIHKSHEPLAHNEGIQSRKPYTSSGSHVTIDPAICQCHERSRRDSTGIPGAQSQGHAVMHGNEAPHPREAFITRDPDFMRAEYAHCCDTSDARRSRPHTSNINPSRFMALNDVSMRLKQEKASDRVVDQTRTAANAVINDIANEGLTDHKVRLLDSQPPQAAPSHQSSVTSETLATQISSDRGMMSNIAGPPDADNSSAHTPTERHANETDMKSYKAFSLAPAGEVYNANVIKVSARKVAKPQSLYKAHLLNDAQSQWLPASQIPPAVLAKFLVQRYIRSQTRKHKPRGISRQQKKFSKTPTST